MAEGKVMPEWLEALWSFLASLPRGIYGDRIDSGWGIAASIFVSVVAIAFVIGGYRSIHEYIKAADGTPPRKVDWLQARRQEVQSLRFTIPFGILVFTVLYLWVRDSFALDSYFRLAVGWVLFLLVLRVWWIATAIWTERKLVKNDLLATGKSQLHNVTIGWAVRHYLNWGLQKSTVKRPPFIGIFRIFNPVVKLFGLRWLQFRLVRPLFVITFYACTWPISMVIAVFYLTREFSSRSRPLKPEWASSYASEPTYGSGAIPDTPGDAQAAVS